jgi:hypothetical protein
MPLLSRKRTILAKTEVTYGTDSVPTGTANAILVRNLNITPLNAELVSRDLIRPYLGASEQVLASSYVTVDFEVEMAGSGTAGTAPGYGPLLLACGMSAAISAGVSVTYTPISSSTPPSVTLYYNIDGVLHRITGSRGTVELQIQVGQIPVFRFTFTGLYNAPADTAAPAVTYTAFQTPLAANGDNTSAFSLYSYSGALQSLSLNINNTINYRTLIGAEDVQMTDRQVNGTAVFEAPTITQKDYFSLALGSALGNLAITHGTAAGNRVEITSTRAKVVNPTYQDLNGIHMLQVPFNLIPSTAGNDEFSIIVR